MAWADRVIGLGLCVLQVQAVWAADAAEPDRASVCTPAQSEPRRRPGAEEEQALPVPCDPSRLPTPRAEQLPPPQALADRWRIVEALGYADNRIDPYAGNNPLKGDRPVFGTDGFGSLSASSSTLLEPRRVPTAGAAASVDQLFFSENASVDAVLYKGDTVFRPPDYLVRFTPVVTYTRTHSTASTTAVTAFGVQSLFFEKHLREVSPQYDFDSVRLGIQPMTTDFRGFLMLDQPAGIRLFGTRANNRYQYNLGWFRPLAKNAARQNDIGAPIPKEDVLIANLYRQDLFASGFNAEMVLVYDRNRAPGIHLAPDGVTPDVPAAFGLDARHDSDIVYLGASGDGHLGRLNLTAALYYALGNETPGPLSDAGTRVRASFAALELSRDFDGLRLRLSALHASGDADPQDRRATAFVGLNSSPLFAGADASFFFHQRLPLTGTLDLKQRDRLFDDLRSGAAGAASSSLGPGLNLTGLGTDFDVSPRLRLSLDVNQLWFAEVAPLALVTGRTGLVKNIGQDLSLDAFFRPFDSQNLILRFSGAVLEPGRGYRGLYGNGTPYSFLMNLVLTY
jgi:hypothetical protein